MQWSDDEVINTIVSIKQDTAITRTQLHNMEQRLYNQRKEFDNCRAINLKRLNKLEQKKRVNIAKKTGLMALVASLSAGAVELLRYLRGG